MRNLCMQWDRNIMWDIDMLKGCYLLQAIWVRCSCILGLVFNYWLGGSYMPLLTTLRVSLGHFVIYCRTYFICEKVSLHRSGKTEIFWKEKFLWTGRFLKHGQRGLKWKFHIVHIMTIQKIGWGHNHERCISYQESNGHDSIQTSHYTSLLQSCMPQKHCFIFWKENCNG